MITSTPTTNPCRICGSEIIKGRGNYRTEAGLICFRCLKGMTPLEKKTEEKAAAQWAFQESERELRELEEQEYLAAQKAIGEVLFPLTGPRSAASKEVLKKLLVALADPDPLDRAMKVNSLIRAASPGIEAGIRELQKKRQGKAQASTANDPSLTPQATPMSTQEGGK